MKKLEKVLNLRNLVTSSNLPQTIEQVVVAARSIFAVDQAFLFLPNHEQNRLTRFSEGNTVSYTDDGYISLDEEDTPVVQVIRSHKTLQLQSEIYVPLVASEHCMGILALISENSDKFTEEDLQLFELFSNHIALAIRSAQLQERVEYLSHAEWERQNYLINMSNELRTPLNAVIGYSQVMLKETNYKLPELQQQFITIIHDSGKHLLNLINHYIDKARIDTGKIELSREFFNLTAVIQRVIFSTEVQIGDRAVTLHSDIKGDLPKAFGDEYRTQHILLELLSNAVKFTNEGTIRIIAHRIHQNDRSMIQVSVKDMSSGIASDDLDKLFDPLRHTSERGLGLPLAKSLIELQGGSIWVESEMGQGLTLSITIPTEPLTEASD